jgi:hypothetical protein
MTMKSDLSFESAHDLALRYSCKLPDYHEDDPRAALWIAAIAELPLAEQQGRHLPDSTDFLDIWNIWTT